MCLFRLFCGWIFPYCVGISSYCFGISHYCFGISHYVCWKFPLLFWNFPLLCSFASLHGYSKEVTQVSIDLLDCVHETPMKDMINEQTSNTV